jgi:hypothetical protein
LGLCGYYRNLVPHFAEFSAPLYAVGHEANLEPRSELLENFDKLKEYLYLLIFSSF